MIGFATLIAAAVSPFTPQPVIVGPFKLGDMILSKPNGDWLAKELKAGGLDLDDVKKQMNGWNLYILDHKVRHLDGQWKWHRPEGGGWRSQLLVEGKLSISVKDAKGEVVEIDLRECSAPGIHTDNWMNGRKDQPATVWCRPFVTLRFQNLVNGEIHKPELGHTRLPVIRYDVTGRSAVERPAPKK